MAEQSSYAQEEEPKGTETGRCFAAAISCLAMGHRASGNAVSLSQIGKHRPRESNDTQDEKRCCNCPQTGNTNNRPTCMTQNSPTQRDALRLVGLQLSITASTQPHIPKHSRLQYWEI